VKNDFPAFHKILDSIESGDASKPDYQVRPISVCEFFDGTSVKKIPEYQRPYAWEDANVLDLWNDILKAATRGSGWFLGPVFTVKQKKDSRVEELLDGQQRVTTLQLILKELTFVKLRFDAFPWPEFPELHGELDDVINGARYCISSMASPNKELRFEAEPQSNEILKKYLLISSAIDARTLRIQKKEFEESAEKKRVEGSKTAGRLNQTVSLLDKQFAALCGDCRRDKLEQVIQFGKTLLNDVWFIQIPLNKEKYTEQIFEGLNNRGKSLSLVSKLRFKCLLHAEESSADDVRLRWKEIYAGLEFMDDYGFIKSDDDFFKVFINSIDGAGLTKERDLVNHFTAKCIFEESQSIEHEHHSEHDDFRVDQKRMNSALEDILRVQEFYKQLGHNLTGQSKFMMHFQSRQEREKVQALLEVFKHCLKFSDNSRFLLFRAIKNCDWSIIEEDAIGLVNELWKILCVVFLTEVVAEEKSNRTRIIYLGTLKESSKNDEEERKTLEELFTEKDDLPDMAITGMLRTNDSDRAKFILAFYAMFKNPDSLIQFAPEQLKNCHLEHLWPQAFQNSWGEVSGYSLEDVKHSLKGLAGDFPFLSSEKILDASRLDDMLLREYSTKPYSQKNSLVQWIGNKWILHAGTNIKARNESFTEKFKWYQNPAFVKIPGNQIEQTGINHFKDTRFDHEAVVARSLRILNDLVQGVVSTDGFV
jgi:uncharacterized protein with ParB-like and HNH nuclease domain